MVPDAAAGKLIPTIMREDPTIQDVFDGFVYYGNTAAVGTFTMSNTAALLAGPAYTPLEINKRMDKTLIEVVKEAYRQLSVRLERNDYAINIMGPSLIGCDDLRGTYSCDYTSTYREVLYNNYDYEFRNAFDKRLLFLLSAFKALPLSAKSILYQSAYWSEVFEKQPNTAQSMRYYEYLFVKSLAQFSNVEFSTRKNRFIHLWLQVLIAPFFLDEDCNIAYRSWDMWDMEARKDSTACFLKSMRPWFDWMKQNGVYDNSKIIIAADHGADDYGENWYKGAVTPLLMVKDFDRRGELKESDILMSNSDVLSIICTAFESGCTGVPSDPTRTVENGRILTYSITTHGNRDFSRSSKMFDIVRYYEISGNVHDREKWIEKEYDK